MKAIILLAITGGLFFTSPGLNTKHVKSTKTGTKSYAKHCIKKCCHNTKKVKSAS